MLSENDIARIIGRIVRHDTTLAVGIFGSYGVGAARPGSDLDLFVIKDSVHRPTERRLAIGRLLFGVLHPLDIHVFTPTEFEDSAYETLSFAWVIARQARLFHWTEEAKQRVPSLFVHATMSYSARTSVGGLTQL
jgi:predicted nucleotidyltransferase